MLAAAGLGVALLAAAVVTGVVLNGRDAAPASDADANGPVLLVPVDSPQAGSAGCANLVSKLPQRLPNNGGTLNRLALAKPAPQGAAAWGESDDPAVLRCGVEQPPEFTATSQLLVVGTPGVQWLQVNGDGAATWYTVDRAATVALTLPSGSGTGPIQELSSTIAASMPAVPLHPNGR